MDKNMVLGILAHVDAGKTTLSESFLYLTGEIRRQGRVDHRDAFLDTYELEKKRGITIFSKQAVFRLGEKRVTLLDTPGHVDFSAEMERTLSVLDYAVLVISGPEGPEDHSKALFGLLRRAGVPTFIFVNKMDREVCVKEDIMRAIKARLSPACTDFSDEEDMAACDEKILESYLERGELTAADKRRIERLVKNRLVFPCFFGSALKLTGIEEFLKGLEEYTETSCYGEEFCGRVFKIARDEQGKRLTYMKIMGGSLKPKEPVTGGGYETWEEKADELRIYSGKKYTLTKEAESGMVIAVTGLSKTVSGETVFKSGEHISDAAKTVIRSNDVKLKGITEPVMEYKLVFPEGTDEVRMWENLRGLSDELPELKLRRDDKLREIRIRVMGEVQAEILKNIIYERFGTEVSFGEGEILYKETIADRVEGVGHYEPLRHYAEVHLILEPLPEGSGIEVSSECSTDVLASNWQNGILSRLMEYKHRGVLTGSELTDVRIKLVSGRAHEKHTEGGDFSQAALRAVRQGLMEAESILLEPFYDFAITIPRELAGRVMNDLGKKNADFSEPESGEDGEMLVLRGSAPVSKLGNYPMELRSFSGGRGRISLELSGYRPAADQEEQVSRIGYDPESDMENPTGSVFCVHGGGFYVPWNEVKAHMHLESTIKKKSGEAEALTTPEPYSESGERGAGSGGALSEGSYAAFSREEKELSEIFIRTYGESKRSRDMFRSVQASGVGNRLEGGKGEKKAALGMKKVKAREEYLLVDGYNIIFAWDELRKLAETNIDSARVSLMERLANYQGYRKMKLILVFDAYKVHGNHGSVEEYHNIYVVYTKEAETADQYIAKAVTEISDSYNVTVATSDSLVQLIIFGKSAIRMSARELLEEVKLAESEMRERYLGSRSDIRSRVADFMEDKEKS